jgi:hypothetical protein
LGHFFVHRCWQVPRLENAVISWKLKDIVPYALPPMQYCFMSQHDASDMSFRAEDKGKEWPLELLIKGYALWPGHIRLTWDILSCADGKFKCITGDKSQMFLIINAVKPSYTIQEENLGLDIE